MDELLRKGIALFNNYEFFQCHEVLEEAWGQEKGPRRLFVQALIHVAVGFYHCQRGNSAGACGQLRKGLRKLAGYLPSCEHIDIERLHREATAVLERVEAGSAVYGYPQIHASPTPDHCSP